METVESVISGLKLLADDKVKISVGKFGIPSEKVLGIKVPELRRIAKAIEKNHSMALELWEHDIHEAKLLASMIADPARMTSREMDKWVADIYSWDICDQCCGNLFIYTPHWKKKVAEWIPATHEFTRRAGMVLIAVATMHQKKQVTDPELLNMLQQALQVAEDPRNFVKKALSWALRQVAKKRPQLLPYVIEMAKELRETKENTKKWIANDVLRELDQRA